MKIKSIYIPLLTVLAMLVPIACASIGSPEGGPKDTTPPKVIKCLPENQSAHNSRKKVSIYFDEYIKLENANEKVVISPPQMEMPEIKASGKKISVELLDSLKQNTTYTIDFSDAIVDNNEGNPLGLFTYSFSTGETIDTMEVSGTLLEAENLEPIKGLLIGLHRNIADSAFTRLPFDRVSRTDSRGRFTIKGVAPGTYRIYALEEADGNFMFNQKSEKIAFDTTCIIPSCAPATRPDTIWRDSTHIDSIRTVSYTRFYPDNIVLKAFKEEFYSLHLLKTERATPFSFSIYFTGPCDSLPVLKGLNFDEKDAFLIESSYHNDTITYWIPDSALAMKDTLTISLSYLDTDTLNQLVPRTDTIDIVAKKTLTKIKEELQKQIEEWEKDQEKKNRKRKKQDENIPQEPNPYLKKEALTYQLQPSGSIAPDQNIKITFTEPVVRLDSAAFHFFKKVDTLWHEEPFLLMPVENDRRSFMLYAEWRPENSYKLNIDSAGIHSVLNKTNEKIEKEITVSSLDDFSSIFIKLITPDTNNVVQLLNKDDKVVRSVKAVNKEADFYYLPPGDYYLRLFVDRNGDGKWTTGLYEKNIQPEEVFYFPKPLVARAKWEIEQDWDVRGIPITKQKPEAITKQKPDKEKQPQRQYSTSR